MVVSRKKKVVGWVGALLFPLFLSSCVHLVVQEITVKSKFAKKYDCPRKKITIVEDDANSAGDVYKLVGCGVTALYNGTKEIDSHK